MSLVPKHSAERFVQLVSVLVEEMGSQAAVGRLIGVSPAYVGKIVRGEGGGGVRETTLREAARALHLPLEFFEDDTPVREYKSAQRETKRVLSEMDRPRPLEFSHEHGFLRIEIEGTLLTAALAGKTHSVDVDDRLRRVARAITNAPIVQAAMMVERAEDAAERRAAGKILARALTDPHMNFTGKAVGQLTLRRGLDAESDNT